MGKENKIEELNRIQNCFMNFEGKFDKFLRKEEDKNKSFLSVYKKYKRELKEEVGNTIIFDKIKAPFDEKLPQILTDNELEESVTKEEFKTYYTGGTNFDVRQTVVQRIGTVISYNEYMLNIAYEKTVRKIFDGAKECIRNGEATTIEEAVEKSIKELTKEAIIEEYVRNRDLEEIEDKYNLKLTEDEKIEILNEANKIIEKEKVKTEEEKRGELKEKEKFYITRINELYDASIKREVNYENLESTELRNMERELKEIEQLNRKVERFYKERKSEIEEKKKNKIKEITGRKGNELGRELTEKEVEYVNREAEEDVRKEIYEEAVRKYEEKKEEEKRYIEEEIKKSRESGEIYKKTKELERKFERENKTPLAEVPDWIKKKYVYESREIIEIEEKIREELLQKIQNGRKETDEEKKEREFVENVEKLNEEINGFGWEGKNISDKYALTIVENLNELEEIQKQLGEKREKNLDVKVENLKYELFKYGNKVENWKDMKNKLIKVRRERIAATKIRCVNERKNLIELMNEVEKRESKKLTEEEKQEIVKNLNSRKTIVGVYKYLIMPFLSKHKTNNSILKLFRDVRDKEKINIGKIKRDIENFLKGVPQENLEKINTILSIEGVRKRLDEISKDSGIKLGTFISINIKDKYITNSIGH